MATVYAIASAKGGVGKTTTTAAVATLLAESGADVVAIDADIGMANLADALGVGPGETTIHDVLAGDADPEAAVHEGPAGLRVVPGETEIDAYAAADPSRLRAVVEAFADADYVFLDAGAGLSHDSTLPLGLADETLLVSTPERSALGDTEKTRQLVGRLGGSVAGAAITRVDATDPDDEAGIIETILNADVLGRIPEDAAISRANAAGGSVVSVEPNAPASRAYRDLARALTGATIGDPDPDEDGDEAEADRDPSVPNEYEPEEEAEEPGGDEAEDDDLIVADSGPVGISEAGDEEEIIVADEQPVEESGVVEGAFDGTDEVDEPEDQVDERDGKVDEPEDQVDEPDEVSRADDDDPEEHGAEDGNRDGSEADEGHVIDSPENRSPDPTGGPSVAEGIPDAEKGEREHASDRISAGGDESDEEPERNTKEEPEPDVDDELAGSVPFRDDDTGTMETALSRTDEDGSGTDGADGNGDDDEDDDEKGGFFSRLLGR